MYDVETYRALVKGHEIEWHRAVRRAVRFRRFRSPAYNLVLDRLAEDAHNSFRDAERFLLDALAEHDRMLGR